jgi:hypothetical protein
MTIRIDITSDYGCIRIGSFQFDWENKYKDISGECAISIDPIGDDGYILWCIGGDYVNCFDYDFFLFDKLITNIDYK